MPVPTIDLTQYDLAVTNIHKIRAHRQTVGDMTGAEEMYYTLLIKLFDEVKDASTSGKPWFLYEMSVPNELFAAIGVPAMEYDMACGSITSLIRGHEAVYGAAMKVGVREEICSAQRTPIGMFAKGWFPRPTGIVFSNLDQCDNCAQTGNLMGFIYEVPTFIINRAFRWGSERGVEMMTGEMEDAIAFIEEKSGRTMDRSRLKEAIAISAEQIKLIRKIHKMAMLKPSPMKARAATFAHWIRWAYAGREEGLEYFQVWHDEMKALADQGKGIIETEKHRLISLFTPPQNQMKMLDWLENDMGVVLVAEPYYLRYGDYDMDPSKPTEALARQYFNESYYRFYGQMEEYLDMIVQDAKESGAEAALNWFNSKCRMVGAMTKIVKETLSEQVGIPTCTIDVDLLDPSPAAEKRTKERIEGFLEQLSSGKKKTA